MFKLSKPINFIGYKLEYLGFSNYANDRTYSPASKTAITVTLGGDSYDFWQQAKENGSYNDEKKKLENAVVEAIEEQIPKTKGKIEVCDIATPLTYERYCGTWKGSWMTAMGADSEMEPYPSFIEGIDGLYFSGQRMIPPGGLPVALMTAKAAVDLIRSQIAV